MTFVGSTVVPIYFFHTGNDLGVMGLYNLYKTDEVSTETADSWKFGIFCRGG